MNQQVRNFLSQMNGSEKAQLIGRATQFITNSNFINILNLIDINDRTGKTINNVCNQLAAFNSDQILAEQVQNWLSS
jgi:hypothetical protein